MRKRQDTLAIRFRTMHIASKLLLLRRKATTHTCIKKKHQHRVTSQRENEKNFHGNDGTKMWNLVSCILYKCGFSSAYFSYNAPETFISRRAITFFMVYSGRKTKFRKRFFFICDRVCQFLSPFTPLGRCFRHQHITNIFLSTPLVCLP